MPTRNDDVFIVDPGAGANRAVFVSNGGEAKTLTVQMNGTLSVDSTLLVFGNVVNNGTINVKLSSNLILSWFSLIWKNAASS